MSIAERSWEMSLQGEPISSSQRMIQDHYYPCGRGKIIDINSWPAPNNCKGSDCKGSDCKVGQLSLRYSR